METHDVTIIGAGPAGIAAAVQLRRCGLDPLVLEAQRIGGLLLNANCVENYPGFPKGIAGPELIELFKAQLAAWDVRVFFEEVRQLSFADGLFLVETTHQTTSRLVIVASGTQPTRAALECQEQRAEIRRKIFYEVFPLLKTQAKKIAIVGGGDAALDYALNLARANEVVILHRGQKRKALPLLWQRALACPRITYYEQTQLVNIEPARTGLKIMCMNAVGRLEMTADYLLIAIGRRPRLAFLDAHLPVAQLCRQGRLYFIGDVRNDRYRQTAISVGDGVYAAMQAYEILEEEREL